MSGIWLPALVFVGSATLQLLTGGFGNDHFDRITRARQMAAYGAVPFRDFFDPGYGLTLYCSAWLQTLLNYSLLGDAILCIVAIAAGFTVTYVLAERASGSRTVALLLTAPLVALSPRWYDFDKVLFYPLGVAACWAYAKRPSRARLAWLAAVTALGAMFRYDNGIYLGSAALVAVAVTHWRQWADLCKRAAWYVAAVGIGLSPALVVLAIHGEVADAFDQIATYAAREGSRTGWFGPPKPTVDWSAPFLEVEKSDPVGPVVKVRWDPAVDDALRTRLEQEFELAGGRLDSERTWSYRLQNHAPALVERLVQDRRVEDTAGINRATFTVAGLVEQPLDVWRRRLPVLRFHLLPGWLRHENAAPWLYYLVVLLPPVAVLAWLLDVRVSGASTAQASLVLSTSTLCLLVNGFVLREPIGARIGAVAVPGPVLAAWLWRRLVDSRRQEGGTTSATGRGRAVKLLRRTGFAASVCVFLTLTWASVLVLNDWGPRLIKAQPLTVSSVQSGLADTLRALAASPLDLALLPRGPDKGLVTYFRDCSTPADPIMATWFFPEVYAFADRPFAAGMVVFFGGHWSEPRFERRALAALAAHPPSIVIERKKNTSFEADYPFIAEYVSVHYVAAGETDFGNEEVGERGYRVLARRGLVATTTTDGHGGLPCFGR